MESLNLTPEGLDPRLVHFLTVNVGEMPMNEINPNNIDFTETLKQALFQLNNIQAAMQQPSPPPVFPKPRKIFSMADIAADPENLRPLTTKEIIDKIVASFDNYPVLVQIMMHRGFLKKRQQCRKCDKEMHMRRRKNSYEWRCRTKDKRGDCSSCSIKTGSWFETNKLTFKVFFELMILHTKGHSTSHIVNELKLSTHSVNENRKAIFDLCSRVVDRYPRIGGPGKEVYVELITVSSKRSSYSPKHKVLAAQEVGSKRCFAYVLPDEKAASLVHLQRRSIAPGTKITAVVTVNKQEVACASQNTMFLDENLVNNGTAHPDRFFTSLRNPIPESFAVNAETAQNYLNDLVVRRIEGPRYMEKCVEEIRHFVRS